MKRPWLWLVAACMASGCQNSPPATNPFIKTTIDPPPTGAAVPPGGAAPYNGPAAAPAAGAPGTPAGTGKPATGPYTPPGGSFGYPQSSNSADDSLDVAERAARSSLARKDGSPSQPPGEPSPDAIAAAGDKLPTLGRPDEGAMQMRVASLGESPGDTGASTTAATDGGARARKPTNLRRDAPATAAALDRSGAARFGEVLASAAGAATDTADSAAGRVRSLRSDAAEAAARSIASDGDNRLESSGGERSSLRIVEGAADAVSSVADSSSPRPAAHAATRIGVVADGSAVAAATAAVGTSPAASRFHGATSAAPRAAAASAPAGRAAAGDAGRVYDHDADYRWVRGKLEYSRTARQWKLRYIPIDGQTDRYGGSVVLPEGTVPSEFAPGDLVVVRGAIDSQAAGRNFSPRFAVEQIDHQNP